MHLRPKEGNDRETEGAFEENKGKGRIQSGIWGKMGWKGDFVKGKRGATWRVLQREIYHRQRHRRPQG